MKPYFRETEPDARRPDGTWPAGWYFDLGSGEFTELCGPYASESEAAREARRAAKGLRFFAGRRRRKS